MLPLDSVCLASSKKVHTRNFIEAEAAGTLVTVEKVNVESPIRLDALELETLKDQLDPDEELNGESRQEPPMPLSNEERVREEGAQVAFERVLELEKA